MDFYLNVLETHLKNYQDSKNLINQIVSKYEEICLETISKIKTKSFDQCANDFDQLHKIQSILSMMKFKYEFTLSKKMDVFVYCLDRDDEYSRKYWFEKFKNNCNWPDE